MKVRDSAVETATDIVKRFVAEAREEAGPEFFLVNKSATDPAHFVFY